MKSRLVLASIVLLSFSCRASVSNRVNAVFGATVNYLRSYKHKDLLEPLKPEHEELVRSIEKKIGMTQEVKVYKLPASLSRTGPHALYNSIFLDEWELENHPEQALFTIGHELMHVEKMHNLKFLSVALPINLGLSYVTYHAFNKGSRLAPSCCKNKIPWLLRFLLVQAGSWILNDLIQNLTWAPIRQAREYEADRECLDRLAPHYGYDKFIWSATQALGSSGNSLSGIKAWFSTHPSARKRIQALGITEHVSREAGERLLMQLKERVRDYALWCLGECRIPCLLLSQEICSNVSIGAVHSTVAQDVKKMIEESALLELFDTLIAYLKQEKDDDKCLLAFGQEERELFQRLRSKKVEPVVRDGYLKISHMVLKSNIRQVQDVLDGEPCLYIPEAQMIQEAR